MSYAGECTHALLKFLASSLLVSAALICSVALPICLSYCIIPYVNLGFSYLIDVYLRKRYPLLTDDGCYSLPTCPYKFPNGQGNVGKFLEGIENRDSWARKHGRTYRIWSGMIPEIVLTTVDDVQRVFKDSDKHIKAKDNNSGWLMGQLLGKCVGLVSQDEWQPVRAIMETPFLHQPSRSYIPQIEKRTMKHLQDLETDGRLKEGHLHPVKDLRMLPFWIVSDILYGPLRQDEVNELQNLIGLREKLFRRVIAGGVSRFSWSKYLPTQCNQSLREFKTRWAILNDAIYQRLKAQQSSGRTVPVIPMHEAVQTGKMTHEHLYQTLDEILFANLDVTIGGLSWNLLFMCAYPSMQDKLREEIRSVRQTSSSDPSVWTSYLSSSSTLMTASILESARLKPLAAFTVPQAAPTKRGLTGGITIPHHTNFIVDTYALNMKNPYWGEDAAVYRPERFLERSTISSRYQYWRFGFGPRQCMGKYVADLIIKIVMVYLLENYELRFLGEESWVRDPEVWIMHPDKDIECRKFVSS